MQRAAKVTLKFATASKRNRLDALLSRYRAAVNFFIDLLWQGLDPTYHEYPGGQLSARYRSAALRQARGIVLATRESAKSNGVDPGKPHFAGSAVLDAKFVTIEDGKGDHFDIVVRISSLVAGERIVIPTMATRVLRRWLVVPGAKLIQGCALGDDYLTLWVEIPDLPPKEEGDVIAVDIGICKLLSDSDGNHYGTEFRALSAKIRRRKPGSKGRARAHRERDQFVNRTVNLLPWDRLRAIGHENLVGLKTGKKLNRGKSFRKAIAPWTYRKLLAKIDRKADENRVRHLECDPRDTSRTCPECSRCDAGNRKGEKFRCLGCGYTADSDLVGALNLIARTLTALGRLESPRLKNLRRSR